MKDSWNTHVNIFVSSLWNGLFVYLHHQGVVLTILGQTNKSTVSLALPEVYSLKLFFAAQSLWCQSSLNQIRSCSWKWLLLWHIRDYDKWPQCALPVILEYDMTGICSRDLLIFCLNDVDRHQLNVSPWQLFSSYPIATVTTVTCMHCWVDVDLRCRMMLRIMLTVLLWK